jgi:hypothetical protein
MPAADEARRTLTDTRRSPRFVMLTAGVECPSRFHFDGAACRVPYPMMSSTSRNCMTMRNSLSLRRSQPNLGRFT